MAYPLTEQKAFQKQKEGTPHTQIDDLIATNDLQQVSDWSWLKEFLLGPEGIDMGYPPDIALSPLFSKTSIMSTLKNLFKGKPKSQFNVGYGQPSSRYAKSQLQDALEAVYDPSYLQPSKVTPKSQDELIKILGELGFGKTGPNTPKITPRKIWE